MKASTAPLEGNRVKLTVEVGEDELTAVREETVAKLLTDARLPGFRPGKVPRRVLEARLGSKAIREQAIAEALPRYYEEAVEDQELDVIAQHEVDVTSGQESGPVVFDAVVELRPQVELQGYQDLEITLPGLQATDAEVQAQLDRLREQFAQLSDVDRPAATGDVLTLDVRASRGGAALPDLDLEDQTYELGGGSLAEGADEALLGAKLGDIVPLEVPVEGQQPIELKIMVKRVREKLLPEADDSFASDASEFDTIDELITDLTSRISTSKRMQARFELREKALQALAGLVDIELPEVLVDHEQQHLASDLVGRLERQHIRLGDYLMATGRDEQALLDELAEQARLQVRADLALRGLAAAEGLEVDESDLDEEIVKLAGRAGRSPAEVREALEREGRIPALRSDLRSAKALAWLVEHVGIVDDEGNPMDRSVLLADDTDTDADVTTTAAGETGTADTEE